MSTWQNRRCPNCSSLDIPSEPEVSSRLKAESLTLDDLRTHWNTVQKERAYFSYFRCGHCRLLFCSVYFMESDLHELYRRMADNTLGLPTDAVRKTQRGYFNVLRQYSPLQGGYLEVGPDLGFFTECCLEQGSYEHFWLFEPKSEVQPVSQIIR